MMENIKLFFIGFVVLSFLIVFIVGGFVLGSKSKPEILLSPTPITKLEIKPKPSCGICPQYSPQSADFCKGGTVIPGGKNECGCQLPPTCQK